MLISLTGYKVVYGDKVLKAIALMRFKEKEIKETDIHIGIELLEIMVINDDGNIEIIRDEAWMFQFIPILGGTK